MSSMTERLLADYDKAVDEYYDFLKGESERRRQWRAAKSEHDMTDQEKCLILLERMEDERHERERLKAKIEARRKLKEVE